MLCYGTRVIFDQRKELLLQMDCGNFSSSLSVQQLEAESFQHYYL